MEKVKRFVLVPEHVWKLSLHSKSSDAPLTMHRSKSKSTGTTTKIKPDLTRNRLNKILNARDAHTSVSNHNVRKSTQPSNPHQHQGVSYQMEEAEQPSLFQSEPLLDKLVFTWCSNI